MNREDYLKDIWDRTDINYNGYKVSFRSKAFRIIDIKLPAEKRYEFFKMFGEDANKLSWVAFSVTPDGSWGVFLYGGDGGRLCERQEDKAFYSPIVSHIRKVLQPECDSLKRQFKEQVDLNTVRECQSIIDEIKKD